MNYQIAFHSLAEKEYTEAYHWYEEEQKGLGDRFEKMVEQRLQQILQHPEHYSISKASYREVSVEVFPYTIVYKLNKKKKIIYVVAIYHHKRNTKSKYRKPE